MSFQGNAFQASAFQVGVAGGATSHNSGGWHYHREPRRKTKEDIDEERVALGIIPAPVKKVVEKAAKRVISRSKTQEASVSAPDPLKWLAEHQAQQKAILQRELREKQIGASLRQQQIYMALLRIEVEALIEAKRLQDEEDEQIVMLLLQM